MPHPPILAPRSTLCERNTRHSGPIRSLAARPFTNLEIKVCSGMPRMTGKLIGSWSLNYGMRWGFTSRLRKSIAGFDFDPKLYNPAAAPLLYLPVCRNAAGATVALTSVACATANRRALNPSQVHFN